MGLGTREPRPTQTEGKFISLKNEYKALIKKKQFNYPFARTVFSCPLPWFATTTRTALCFLAATVAGTTSHALPPIVIRPISLTSVSLSTATVVTVRLRKSKKQILNTLILKETEPLRTVYRYIVYWKSHIQGL